MFSIVELNDSFNSLFDGKQSKGKGLPVGIDGMTGLNFKKNQTCNIQEIKRGLDSFNTPNNRFEFGVLFQIKRVKKSGGHRHLYVPRIRDQIVFKCMFEELKTVMNVGGLLLNTSPRKYVERFHEYLDKNDGQWVLRTDISSFYDSIDRSILLSELKELNLRESLFMLLKQWLGNVRYRDSLSLKDQQLQNGLPQGISLSSLLAEFYLSSVDAKFGLEYFRYIDDIIISCRSREEAREYLSRLKKILNSKGLEISGLKTQIAPLSNGVEWLGLRHYANRVIHADIEKYGEWKQGVVKVIREVRNKYPERMTKETDGIIIKKELFLKVNGYLQGDYQRRTHWYNLILDQGQWKDFDSYIHGQIKFALKFYGLTIENSDILPSVQLNVSRVKKG